jgi:hypothetical protein
MHQTLTQVFFLGLKRLFILSTQEAIILSTQEALYFEALYFFHSTPLATDDSLRLSYYHCTIFFNKACYLYHNCFSCMSNYLHKT